MTDDDSAALSVWAHVGGGEWRVQGELPPPREMRFSDAWADPGDLEASWEFDTDLLLAVTSPSSLVLVEFRGWEGLYQIVPNWSLQASAESLSVTGDSALGLLDRVDAWPDGQLALEQQPETPVLYSGPAGNVVRALVRDNYAARVDAMPLTVQSANPVGIDVRARGKFTNLLELVARKARRGGIGVEVVLTRSDDSHGTLELRVWQPPDLSADVDLSEAVGTLAGYQTTVEPPTLTRAIMRRADGSYLPVTTQESNADADAWGGHRAHLVDGPDSYDDPDLIEAGQEALRDGRSKVNAALTGADTEGLRALRDFRAGDLVTGLVAGWAPVVDNVSAVEATFDESGLAEVVTKFGDPDADDAVVGLAQLIRSQDRRLRAQERKG